MVKPFVPFSIVGVLVALLGCVPKDVIPSAPNHPATPGAPSGEPQAVRADGGVVEEAV